MNATHKLYMESNPPVSPASFVLCDTIPLTFFIFKSRLGSSFSLTLLIPWNCNQERKGDDVVACNVDGLFNYNSCLNSRGSLPYWNDTLHIFTLPLSPPVPLQSTLPCWLDRETTYNRLRLGGSMLGITPGELMLVTHAIEVITVRVVYLNLWHHLPNDMKAVDSEVIIEENSAKVFIISNEESQVMRQSMLLSSPRFIPRQDLSPITAKSTDMSNDDELSINIGQPQRVKDEDESFFGVDQLDFMWSRLVSPDKTEVKRPLFSPTLSNNLRTVSNRNGTSKLSSSNIFISPLTMSPSSCMKNSSYEGDCDGDSVLLNTTDFKSPILTRELLLEIFDLDFNENASMSDNNKSTMMESQRSQFETFKSNEIEKVGDLSKRGNISNSDDKNEALNCRPSNHTYTVTEPSSLQTRELQTTQQSRFVLKLPTSVNGFIFICDSRTRQECLERCILAAPAGARYGQHGKCKAGDLVFLADFSDKTVTGVFEAYSSPQINLDRDTFDGRFPFQVKVKTNVELKKISLDRAFEYMKLPFGAKLNMLSREQLLGLIKSPEFEACIPSRFKEATQISSSALSSIGVSEKNIALRSDIYIATDDTNEHPTVAALRLKETISCLHRYTQAIQDKNIKYNTILSNDMEKYKMREWSSMQYNEIHCGVVQLFNRWLFLAHTLTSYRQKSESNAMSSLKNTWVCTTSQKQQQRDDIVLRVSTFSTSCIVDDLKFALMNCDSKISPSCLRVPSVEMANQLVSLFRRSMEALTKDLRILQKRPSKARYRSSPSKDSKLRIHIKQSSFDFNQLTLEWRTRTLSKTRAFPQQNVFKNIFKALCQQYSALDDQKGEKKLVRIFVLLCRYDILSFNRSNFATLPPHVFDAFNKLFGVHHECFASPLRHYYSSYNSLFPDTDNFFGSLGSFFEYFPVKGSFVCKPPFTDLISLKAMFEHIIDLLETSDDLEEMPLSFIAVLPQMSAFDFVKRSKFMRKTVISKSLVSTNSEAKYFVIDSYKHLYHPQLNIVDVDAQPVFLFLQNDVAFNVWGPSEDKIKILIETFATGKFSS